MLDKPKLRAVQAVPIRHRQQVAVQLFDPTGLSDQVALVPQEMMFLLSLFDGEHSIVDIQAALTRRYGRLVFSHEVQRVIDQLDEALFLESERFQAHVRDLRDRFRKAPVREPSSAGSGYPADPDALRAALAEFFTTEGGPGEPQPGAGDGSLVGLVAPHIDFERGGLSYAHAYKALAQDCEADLFVVLGTAHFSSAAPYILTRKSFRTPLGTMRTCKDLVEVLAARCGRDLFAEELVHKNEHSVEFQVVLLQHVLGDRPLELLPILCGSIESRVGEEQSPADVAEISDFLAALREVLAGSGREVCLIAAADLSHVGRHFGDEYSLTPRVMQEVEEADREALAHVERLDAEGFYQAVSLDGNARHICGVPPIYTLLSVADASRCELLDYRQAADYDLERAVTFAALALYA